MDSSRLDTLKGILEKDPDDSFSRYALGLEYHSASMTEEAKSEFEELLSRDPGYLAVYYQLGKLYETAEDLELAKKTYERGIYVAASQNDMHTKEELEEALENLF